MRRRQTAASRPPGPLVTHRERVVRLGSRVHLNHLLLVHRLLVQAGLLLSIKNRFIGCRRRRVARRVRVVHRKTLRSHG